MKTFMYFLCHFYVIYVLQETLLVEYHRKSITLGSFESLQALLNSVGENAWRGSLAVVGLAATNIALDLLMLLGTCCRVRSITTQLCKTGKILYLFFLCSS